MLIHFTKISDEKHAVKVLRSDGSSEEAVLKSREYFRHDLAHLAVEMEIPLRSGYWGSVAAGTALDGMQIKGREIGIAESLAGPVQTLMRKEAGVEEYKRVVDRSHTLLAPLELASPEIAERIHKRVRKLQGHWRATPYGGEMVIEWQEGP